MTHILDSTTAQLIDWLAERGHAKYRAAQIQDWLFQRRAVEFEQMTNLPKRLRHELTQEFSILTGSVAAHQVAEDGTEKLLMQWADRGQVECVLLRDDGIRRSICISTQVGCAMGCVFCASGLDGVDRNLTTGEILEQMLLLQGLLPADDGSALRPAGEPKNGVAGDRGIGSNSGSKYPA